MVFSRGCSVTAMAIGLLVRIDALAFVDIEHADARDQLPVDVLRGAHDVAGLHVARHDEGEVALDRLERRQVEQRLGLGRLGLRLGDLVENDLERDERTFGAERLQRAGMQFAEIAQHVLRADLDRAAAARMQPGRPAGHDLQRLRRRARRGQQRQRIGLDVEGVDTVAGARPVTAAAEPFARPRRTPLAAMN